MCVRACVRVRLRAYVCVRVRAFACAQCYVMPSAADWRPPTTTPHDAHRLIVFFLTGMVAMIMMRTLHKDISTSVPS